MKKKGKNYFLIKIGLSKVSPLLLIISLFFLFGCSPTTIIPTTPIAYSISQNNPIIEKTIPSNNKLIFNETKIFFYNPLINKTDCINKLGSINPKYYKGINKIDIYLISGNRLGAYRWNSQTIYTTDGCKLSTIIHELAHHKNKVDKVTFLESYKHNKEFTQAEEQIWQDLT